MTARMDEGQAGQAGQAHAQLEESYQKAIAAETAAKQLQQTPWPQLTMEQKLDRTRQVVHQLDNNNRHLQHQVDRLSKAVRELQSNFQAHQHVEGKLMAQITEGGPNKDYYGAEQLAGEVERRIPDWFYPRSTSIAT